MARAVSRSPRSRRLRAPLHGPAPAADQAQVPEGVPDAAASVAAATPVPAPTDAKAVPGSGPASPLAPISVETDVLRLEISPRGGTVSSVWLKHYPIDPERPEDKFRLFKPEPPNMFIAQSGLLGTDPQSVPTHEAIFTSTQTSYTLGERDDILVVELTWGQETGVQVVKRYRFERGQLPRPGDPGGAQRDRRGPDGARLHPAPAHRVARPQRSPVRLHLHRRRLLQPAGQVQEGRLRRHALRAPEQGRDRWLDRHDAALLRLRLGPAPGPGRHLLHQRPGGQPLHHRQVQPGREPRPRGRATASRTASTSAPRSRRPWPPSPPGWI